jgi:hypothetical protein
MAVFGLPTALLVLLVFLFIREPGSLTIPSLLADLAEWTLLGCATGDAPHLVQVYPPNHVAISPTTGYLCLVGVRLIAIVLQHLKGEGVGFYLPVPSIHLPRLTEVVKRFVRHQEHQDLVFAPEFQGAVQPFLLDALPVATRCEETIAYQVAFGYFRPRSVGVTIQGRHAHALVDRVRGMPAHVAVDTVSVAVPRHLACAPKGVPLASPAPHADPVDLGPVVSRQALMDPPQPLGIL